MPSGTKDPAGEPARAVAELIRREMGAQNISRRQLAVAIGKSEKYVRERVSGSKALDLNDLDDIATVLDLDVIVILEQAERVVNQPAARRSVVNMSDYRQAPAEQDEENVGGSGQTATVSTLPIGEDLTAEEAAEILRNYPYAADRRPGRDEEQEADPHP